MKRPYYYLKTDLVHYTENSPITFVSGTLIQPILNDDYLPDHLKSIIVDRNRFLSPERPRFVLCSIGPFWIPVSLDQIKEVI